MPEKTAEPSFATDGLLHHRRSWRRYGGRRPDFHIVGRAKDLIISGGFNVYPKEVESAIDALPGVVESAVIGVPHPDFGEAVVAVVVREDAAVDQTAIASALSDRLARFKQPKRVCFLDSLPRNTMGKVQKKALREQYANSFEAKAD